MSINEIIVILNAAITTQNGSMSDAVKRGDLAEIVRLTQLINETQSTLNKLMTL